MLVAVLPLTTARALEVDALHRMGHLLDSRLRALARWSAADSNQCEYCRALAIADYGSDIASLATTPERLTPLERAAVAFSRRMMTEAHAVTDAEVAELLGFLGEAQLIALVKLLAHASYQDHLLLALAAREEGAMPPPLATRFEKPRPPAPRRLTATISTGKELASPPAEWANTRDELERQKALPGRIRIPSREEMLAKLGEDHPLAWQAGIAWSRACLTHQPELTAAWFACTAAFRQETTFDPVFQQSIFWVITDALRCFY
jgi:hypothetical protein